MIISFKLEHRKKIPSPIVVTELGIATDVNPVHPEKANSSIVVTELGIVTEVRPVQSSVFTTDYYSIFYR